MYVKMEGEIMEKLLKDIKETNVDEGSDQKDVGIWTGMLIGTLVQTIVLIIITWRTDWDKQVLRLLCSAFFSRCSKILCTKFLLNLT
ncbi:Protein DETOXIFICATION [Melia azedarach]|uniref:Protein DETOXIFICATION n=1 Tax=Melia azedarach TaxID=155640 RepID=A0ACC1YEE8_MELAZ|nr:Protein DETOXIFICATION [Melia azedarach]